VKPFGPYIRTDVLDAIGLKDAFAKLKAYEELEPILVAVKEYIGKDKSGKLTHVTYNLSGLLTEENSGYDPQDFMLVVKADDDKAQVKIWSETDEFRKAAELIRKWYQAGYAPSDVKLWEEQDNAWKAGQFAVRISDIVKPGGNAEVEARWGQAVTSIAIAAPILTTGGVTATLNGVSALSANPDLAVKYLELVNSDPAFYNTLCKGIQGTHWDWADKDKQIIKPAGDKKKFDETGYNPNTDWMYGNVFNSYYADASQVGAWPETAKLNRDARPSPVLGFTFDRKPVETEIAAISAARQEFANPLGSGLVDVAEGLPKLNKALKDAGIEKVRDEMQKQIDAWKAAKK
jgi:putative aldouronate transport system substrate-binding protein